MMEAVVGPIPDSMGRRAARDAEKYFRRRGRLAWPEAASSRKSVRAVQRLSSPAEAHRGVLRRLPEARAAAAGALSAQDAMLDVAADAMSEVLLPAFVNAEAF